MYSLYPAALQPYQRELSRHAAERYAVLTAIKERRAQRRHSPRRRRAVQAVANLVAVDISSGNRSW